MRIVFHIICYDVITPSSDRSLILAAVLNVLELHIFNSA